MLFLTMSCIKCFSGDTSLCTFCLQNSHILFNAILQLNGCFIATHHVHAYINLYFDELVRRVDLRRESILAEQDEDTIDSAEKTISRINVKRKVCLANIRHLSIDNHKDKLEQLETLVYSVIKNIESNQTTLLLRHLNELATSLEYIIFFSKSFKLTYSNSLDVGKLRLKHAYQNPRVIFGKHEHYIDHLAHNGKNLLASSAKGFVRIWDLETEECLKEIEPLPTFNYPTDPPINIVFVGAHRILSCVKKYLILFDILANQTVCEYFFHMGNLESPVYVEKNIIFCICKRVHICIFEITQDTIQHRRTFKNLLCTPYETPPIYSCAFAINTKQISSLHTDSFVLATSSSLSAKITLYNNHDNNLVESQYYHHDHCIKSFELFQCYCFCRACTTLLFVDQNILVAGYDTGCIVFWDIGQKCCIRIVNRVGKFDTVKSINLTIDNRIAVGYDCFPRLRWYSSDRYFGHRQRIRIFDLSTYKCLDNIYPDFLGAGEPCAAHMILANNIKRIATYCQKEFILIPF